MLEVTADQDTVELLRVERPGCAMCLHRVLLSSATVHVLLARGLPHDRLASELSTCHADALSLVGGAQSSSTQLVIRTVIGQSTCLLCSQHSAGYSTILMVAMIATTKRMHQGENGMAIYAIPFVCR